MPMPTIPFVYDMSEITCRARCPACADRTQHVFLLGANRWQCQRCPPPMTASQRLAATQAMLDDTKENLEGCQKNCADLAVRATKAEAEVARLREALEQVRACANAIQESPTLKEFDRYVGDPLRRVVDAALGPPPPAEQVKGPRLRTIEEQHAAHLTALAEMSEADAGSTSAAGGQVQEMKASSGRECSCGDPVCDGPKPAPARRWAVVAKGAVRDAQGRWPSYADRAMAERVAHGLCGTVVEVDENGTRTSFARGKADRRRAAHAMGADASLPPPPFRVGEPNPGHPRVGVSIVHDLKIWPDFFDAVVDGRKPFELRRNDRGYQVGEVLRLREWRPFQGDYTGREVERVITYVSQQGAPFLQPGFVALGLREPPVAVSALSISDLAGPGAELIDTTGTAKLDPGQQKRFDEIKGKEIASRGAAGVTTFAGRYGEPCPRCNETKVEPERWMLKRSDGTLNGGLGGEGWDDFGLANDAANEARTDVVPVYRAGTRWAEMKP